MSTGVSVDSAGVSSCGIFSAICIRLLSRSAICRCDSANRRFASAICRCDSANLRFAAFSRSCAATVARREAKILSSRSPSVSSSCGWTRGSRHPIARGRSASLRAIGASSTALASTGFSSTGIQSKRASFSTTFSSPSCGSATSPLSGSGTSVSSCGSATSPSSGSSTGVSSCGSATSPLSGSGTGVSSCVCEPVSDSDSDSDSDPDSELSPSISIGSTVRPLLTVSFLTSIIV